MLVHELEAKAQAIPDEHHRAARKHVPEFPAKRCPLLGCDGSSHDERLRIFNIHTKLGAGFLFCILPLAACAHRPEVAAMRLPSSAEVADYVASNWTQVYADRFGRFVGTSTTGSQFQSVKDLDCSYYYLPTIAQCTFLVTASLTDGTVVTHSLYMQFDRADDSSLRETLLIVETPVHRCTSWRPLASQENC